MLHYGLPFQIYTVSFFGHRHIDRFAIIEERLEKTLIDLLKEHEYVDFLVGKNGEFDQLVSSTINRIKRNFQTENCTHILVLPYHSAMLQNNEKSFSKYYDEIEICPESYSAHFKAAIQIRNQKMVDRSDLIICCIERNSGGAYQTVQYAIRHNKEIINLAMDKND